MNSVMIGTGKNDLKKQHAWKATNGKGSESKWARVFTTTFLVLNIHL